MTQSSTTKIDFENLGIEIISEAYTCTKCSCETFMTETHIYHNSGST